MTFQGIFSIVMISFVLPPLFAVISIGDLDTVHHFNKKKRKEKGGGHYAALLSKFDGTAAVPWFPFLLYLPLLSENPLN